MILLDNREVKKGWNEAKASIAALFEKHGMTIDSSKLWAERRLAYPIRRQSRGTYLLVYATGATSAVNAVRRELELTEYVLRHLFLAVAAVPESAHEPEAEFDVTQIREEELPPPPTDAVPGVEAVPEAVGAATGEGQAPAAAPEEPSK